MVDILVRNVDEATAAQLKKKAKAAGKSVNDIAREALRAAVKPSKEEILGRSGSDPRTHPGEESVTISANSTADFREDRDNDEPYR